jgi:glycosyltransferase involved in cell wall biosynthesis
MSKNILLALPFSGSGVGGGLANFNAELAKALAGAGHNVKVLTMGVQEKFAATAKDHGNAEIVVIQNAEAAKLENLKADEGADRELLYQMLFDKVDDEHAAGPEALGLPTKTQWQPDLVIGHSRFSGHTAIRLKQRWYQAAQVVYFLHSIPIEGTVLSGDLSTGWDKIVAEMTAMPDADIVAGVGPLLARAAVALAAWGALSRLPKPVPMPRIFECIPGTEVAAAPVERKRPDGVLELLLLGRADASIKGLGEIVAAVQLLRREFLDPKFTGTSFKVHIKVRGVPADIPPETANNWIKYMQDIVDNRPENPGAYAKAMERYLLEFEKYQQAYIAYRKYEEALRDYERSPQSTPKPIEVVKPKQPEEPFMAKATKEEPSWIEILPQDKKDVVQADIRAAHALIMPSYFEHFGLVPLEAAGHGIPVLVNEFSGAGHFLAGARMHGLGKDCIVPDATSLNARAGLWAKAFKALYGNYEERAKDAFKIYGELSRYTWAHTAAALVAATEKEHQNWRIPFLTLVQGPEGEVTHSEEVGK